MKRYFGCVVIVLAFLLMVGISKGYALDCTGVGPECAWLAAHPTISNAIVWEDSVLGPLNYSAWSLSRKVALSTAFQTALNGGSYGLNDPPANMLNLGDLDLTETALAEGDAWSLYISYVANSLVLEMGHRVSWSLLDYSDRDLAIFLDSREMFSWNTANQGYMISVNDNVAEPAPPDITYSFLANNSMIAPNRLTTIARLLDWSRNNLHHFGCNSPLNELFVPDCGLGHPDLCPPGYTNYDTILMDWFWQYRGWPPVSRIISGTVVQQNPEYCVHHWTAGCHGTTGFLRAVLRAVNIPVINEHTTGHSQAHFPSEGMYLSHSDDPYNTAIAMPPIPPEELLIDQAKWNVWFGPDVTPEQQAKYVGCRTKELGVEYLPEDILTKYCDDLSKGLSHRAGSVLGNFVTLYSLEELEAGNFWGRMDAKLVPTIAAITPLSGQVGSYVYVSGTNLCRGECRTSNPTATTVSLNGVNIHPLWVDKTFLYFQVPAGASTGNITITVTTSSFPYTIPPCSIQVVSTDVFTIRDDGMCHNKNCDDGNACTIDSCDATTGNCIHTLNTWSCDDGNVCTTDSCDPASGNCIHIFNTLPCDDGNACTTGDFCSNGVCAGTPKNCDDGNVCTTDICHADTGICSHINNTLSCNNGNTCTRDVCSGGVCVGTPKNCDDGNVCTTDTCDAATDNCVYTNNTFPTTTASPLGGAYSTAQEVWLTCHDCTGSGCNKIYYTTDGTTPTTASSVYLVPIYITTSTTLKYFAADLAGNSETVKTQNYIINYPITTASPLGSTYSTAQTVTLTCSDGTGPGCDKIYFTTDGTTPTMASRVYTAPISITAPTTLKYFATNFAGKSEAVKTQNYIVPVAGIDLVISSISGPVTGVIGHTIPVSYTVCNQGSVGTSAMIMNAVYLSTDATITSTDTSISLTFVIGLASGACYTGNSNATIPAGIAPGIYYIGAITDILNQVSDSNETNNAKAGNAITVSAPTIYMLTVTKSGTGSGTVTSSPVNINCGATCSASYALNTSVTLTAVADAGSSFTGWSGGCSGTGTCTITMTADTAVTATFAAKKTLTVAKSGTGVGNVTSSPAGINCGAACSASYALNTSVTLTAVADAGSSFTGWSGGCSGTGTCSIAMSADTTVTATFNVKPPDLIEAALTVSQSGTSLLIGDRVTNQGTGTAGAFDISYYLSLDNIYSAGSDTYLCKRSVASLAAGASNPSSGTTQTTCAIPSVPARSYYVIAVADSGNIVSESTETNNTRSASVSITGIDLLPTAMTATKSGTTGVVVNDTVKNEGSSRAGSFTIRYYLSTDMTYQSGSDIALASASNGTGTCSRTVSSLSAGSSNSSGNKTCYKPSSAVNGVSYYVIVVDDTGSTVSEYVETNNSKPTTGTISW